MSEVLIYTTAYCVYCRAAKTELDELGIDYREVDIGGDQQLRQQLATMARGRRTVPQIFIDGEPIGGYVDLLALQRSGELELLLQ